MIVAILALALLSGLMIVLGIGLLHLGMGALEDKLPGSLRRKPAGSDARDRTPIAPHRLEHAVVIER
jgi:hypothetical protein